MPCLPVCRLQVEPHAQIPRCVDGIGDGKVKSEQSIVTLHHFSLGFQAAVSEISGGKHPADSSHQPVVRSRCQRHIVIYITYIVDCSCITI